MTATVDLPVVRDQLTPRTPPLGRRMAPRLVASGLVHLGLVVVVLLLVNKAPKESVQPPPSFDLVLEPGKPPTGPDVTSQPGSNPTPPAPAASAPTTEAPPELRAAPPGVTAPSAAPPPPLPPAAAQPSVAPPSSVPPQAVASAAALPPSAAPPAPLPPTPAPAAAPPPGASPQAVASAAIPPPALAPPTLAPPAEVPPAEAAPSVAPQMILAPAIPTPPPPAVKELPAVRLALALPDQDTATPDLEPLLAPPPVPAPPAQAPPPVTPPPRRQGATAQRMEITLGEPLRGNITFGGSTAAADDMIHVHGADIGEDWKRALHQWWEEHATYPTEALRRQHEGTVKIHLRIDHAGHVKLVGLENSSGSQWLDAGAQAVFRGETVPPLPASTTEATKDLDLTIDYVLIRR